MTESLPSRDEREREIIARLEALEFAELKEFLRRRLLGQDTLLPDDRDGSRQAPVVAIDFYLKRLVREDLRRACLALASEFVAGRWEGDDASANALLLLCQRLAPEGAGERLRLLIESPRFADLTPELRFRVAQTLLELGPRLPVKTWTDLAAADPARFAGLTFGALERQAPGEAFRFLATLPDDAEVARKIDFALPGFFKRLHGRPDEEAITAELNARFADFPPAVRETVLDWAKQFNVSLSEPASPPINIIHVDFRQACWKLAEADFDQPVLTAAL